MACLRHGGDRKSEDQEVGMPLDQAAKMLNVSPKMVKNVRKVKQKAEPEIVGTMKAGKLTGTAAAQVFKWQLRALLRH